MELAPIVLFVYNRPWHTQQTLEALSKNEWANQSSLFIMADGPKENATDEDLQKIKEVRDLIRQKQWCKEVIIEEKERNYGLADSILNGVTKIVNQYGKIIVLEDDLITSTFFLKYLNTCLKTFEKRCNIYSVSANMFPIKTNLSETVLLPYIATWGWATWKDKWNTCDWKTPDKDHIKQSIYLNHRFNLADYSYSSQFDIDDRNVWGIKWYYNLFKRNGLSVYPSKTLVRNIGLDGTGVNCSESKDDRELASEIDIKFNDSINLEFYSILLRYFEKAEKNDRNIFKKIRKLFK
ncbi:glycosyltransferase family protein [Carboxylicivirga linearis]|uniref:Sugar transferase n=1 Tax=Carboxylicivirga linearis TaxID=1628157 RepID=A0ABS5JUF6_9BACT|nr:hypothetical protein [Carboxylicivirga linearis]MBS2098549.1 hypothetical protein [Carboxylicivirga linearis]